MADMKPPTEAAMAQAMKVLMASIAVENAKSFSGSIAENPTAKLLLRHKAVETLQRAVTKATTIEISAISRTINTHAAIHTLPTELLIKIWSLVLSPFTRLDQEHRPNLYYRCMHTFARVSKSWANILRSEAGLWTYINAGDSWNAVSAAIVRSGDLPLTVVVPNPRTVGDFNSPRDPATGRPTVHWLSATERVEEFCQHMYRWKTVSLCTPAHRTLWGRLQAKNSTAPILEELVVGHRNIYAEGTGLLFGGSTPSLKRIEVRSSEITELDCPFFTALRVLKLAKVSMKLPAAEVLDLLQRCPDLMELTLIDCDIADSEEPRTEPVILGRLRKIHLEKLSPYTCTFILSHIDALKLESLIVVSSAIVLARSRHVPEERVTEAATSHVVSCARNLIRNSKGPHILTILLLPKQVTFQSPDPKAGFSVSIGTTETQHYLRWALKMVGGELPDSVRVSLSFGRGYHCASPELLQLIPEMRATVTTLHFRAGLEGVNALLKHLAKPSKPASEGGRKEWLLPRLAALHFTGTRDFSEGLLRLVDRRFAGSRPALQSPAAELQSLQPVRLWYILFDDVDVDADTLGKLYAALGKERVLWEKRRTR